MKKIFFALSVSFVFLISCNSGSNNEKNATKETSEKAEEPSKKSIETEQKKSTELSIEGQNIWVRQKPSTGDVVMKLNEGDKCKILEKGKKEQIRDMVDYWYKISFNGKEGWVFGAQTNLKTNEEPKLEDFATFLKRFVQANQKNESLKNFIQPQIGIYTGNNPGAMCVSAHSKKATLQLSKSISADNIFDREPKGDFCEGYPNEKDGFYYQKISKEKLPVFAQFNEGGEVETTSITIPSNIIVADYIRVTVISDEYHSSYLYFANIKYTWYLICENFCDCSA